MYCIVLKNLDEHKIDKNNQGLVALRISCVEEQGRQPNLQGKNKMEDPSKIETVRGISVNLWILSEAITFF